MSKPMEVKVRLQRARWRALSMMALILAAGVFIHAQAKTTQNVKDVVIVHGAFADGSGWQSVYRILTRQGYSVTVVQDAPSLSMMMWPGQREPSTHRMVQSFSLAIPMAAP